MTFFLIICMSRHRGLRQAIQLSQQSCDSGNTHESRQLHVLEGWNTLVLVTAFHCLGVICLNLTIYMVLN